MVSHRDQCKDPSVIHVNDLTVNGDAGGKISQFVNDMLLISNYEGFGKGRLQKAFPTITGR